MAAAVAPPPSIDLKAPSSYPIRLGGSITKPADSKTFSTVRYNHKPRRRGREDVTGTVKSGKDDTLRLSLTVGDDAYGYTGTTVEDAGRYVLLCRGSEKEREFVLERLSSGHSFSVISTPSEKDGSKLAKKYQQLPLEDEDDEQHVGNDKDDDPADQDNPFDFRNYLKTKPRAPETTGADTPRSTAATSKPAARPTISTPLAPPKKPTTTSSSSNATQKKRKPQTDPLKPNPKRVKAGTDSTAQQPSSSNPSKAIPSVRIDRKASLRRPSLDDSGELILENETPITEKPPRAPGAMALALSGQLGLGGGPISLRSAASSPASRNASPAPRRPEGVESPAEFEVRGGGEEAVVSPGDYFSGAGEEEEEDGEREDDADVDDLELGSPRQERKAGLGAAAGGGEEGGGGGADEDYDMERELELALAQDDGAGGGQAGVADGESEEESEEE